MIGVFRSRLLFFPQKLLGHSKIFLGKPQIDIFYYNNITFYNYPSLFDALYAENLPSLPPHYYLLVIFNYHKISLSIQLI